MTNLERLRQAGQINFEGAQLVYVGEWDALAVGDTYLAERNTGPKLLTVKRVDQAGGFVVPREPAYCYDLSEVVKVEVKWIL